MLIFGLKLTEIYNEWDYESEWIYIDDALQEGTKDLRCPFCNRVLSAKKASKNKLAHFVHRHSACGDVRRLGKLLHHLPIIDYWLYGLKDTTELRLFNRLRRKRADIDEDRFISYYTNHSNVILYGEEEPLFGYKELGKSKDDYIEKLLNWQLIKTSHYSFGANIFELTWKTKILWGTDWSLKQTYQQISLHWANWLYGGYWGDVFLRWFFDAMSQRLREAYFYLLKINLDDKILYKTGTTILSEQKVITWEKQELKRYGRKIAIEKIYYVDSISLVEPLIRLKYKKYHYSIGHKTGYFDFKKKFSDFKKDLHQVTLLSKGHKEKIKKALKSAANVGKRGKETISGFLGKSKSQKIIALLEDTEQGLSLRAIARQVDCSINTVRKVKRLWDQEQNKPNQ